MSPTLPSRKMTIVLLGILAVGFVVTTTRLGTMAENLLYVGYMATMPVLFGAVVLGGVYFGVRHLLAS
ncbi:hypothetical protein RH831_02530 [Halodesulfurarchaeum sp. HSR-GB]|uniref:Uncharacterized protein n=1 Tax=Halodesulfurarchaeum formicicum TaxID=1873524 RepID=A0A1J1A8X8_9EURY|nr:MULTISPECIES: hypothetical protein [Halodesulfurarchaeum]APE94574.1 hypothetical protein HSR6_0098 [Halodesulfurarchaeum formicicum]MDR5656054.1 hypothetical protein [Halodesulfurarchaeum sp. HSR-GB]